MSTSVVCLFVEVYMLRSSEQ